MTGVDRRRAAVARGKNGFSTGVAQRSVQRSPFVSFVNGVWSEKEGKQCSVRQLCDNLVHLRFSVLVSDWIFFCDIDIIGLRSAVPFDSIVEWRVLRFSCAETSNAFISAIDLRGF